MTGASRGIGRAIAERLARDGFAVLLNASNRDALVAAAVAYLVSEEASYVNGAILDVSGGMYLP